MPLALLALLAAAAPALAEENLPLDITVAADKQRITVGDILNYSIEVTCPSGTKVSAPNAKEQLAPFEIRDSSRTEDTRDDKLEVTLNYQLVIFEVGEREVAGLELEYMLPGVAKAKRVKAPPVKVTVGSVLPPDAKDIKDIRGPVPVKMGADQWLAAGMIALVILAALTALAWFIVRRLRRRGEGRAPEIIIGAHERALRELDSLRASDLLPSGQIKAYYTGLSEIVREYLEARFGVRAMEETTWMIRRDLERRKDAREWGDDFVGLLRRADLVKFARQEVADDEAAADLGRARQAVTDSRLIPQPSSHEPTAMAVVE